jgi:hypothetical protein
LAAAKTAKTAKKTPQPQLSPPPPPPRAVAHSPLHADPILYADISFPLFNLFGERRESSQIVHSEYAQIDHHVTSEIRASLDLGRA